MRIRALIVAGLLGAGTLLFSATPAAAHEDVHVGPIELVIGFAVEPAYAGQPNGVQVILSQDGEALTDLGDELEVTVATGDQTSEPYVLEAAFEVGEFGTPGDYRADFVPSVPGAYTFHLTGTFHGQKFDEEVTSGPRTFGDVEDVAAASFPQVTSPSNEELATRIEQESMRGADAVAAAQAAAASADDAASSARTVGMIGLAVGALGLLMAIAAIVRTRKATG